MDLWIDVETSGGTKQGAGPITTALYWESTKRLNRAGGFRFAMPAGDGRAANATPKKTVRCYGLVRGAVQEIGAGVVDEIEVQVNHEGNAQIVFSGDDLLRELTYRSVHDLAVYGEQAVTADEVMSYNAGSYYGMPNAHDGNSGTMDFVQMQASDSYLYIGHDEPFNAVTFTLSGSVNAVVTGSEWQFSRGEDLFEDETVTDGTVSGGAPLAQSGTISFTRPPYWVQTTVNGVTKYWIRLDVDALLDTVDIYEVSVTVRVPTSADLAPIMALAPSGWTLDTGSWYAGTTNGTIALWSGETVLGALVKLAERTGEHFRLGDGREVEWLRTDTPDSGARAVQEFDVADSLNFSEICLILELEELEDSYDLISRIYPYGAGNAAVRVSLSECTESAPAGYTLSTAENYLKNDATESTYGRIEKVVSFKEISPVDGAGVEEKEASNALYHAALAYLQHHDAPYKSYRLRLAKLDREVKPGETIRVSYLRIVDGYRAVEIEEDLIILEATTRIDREGLRTVSMVCATRSRWPESEESAVARAIEQAMAYQNHVQPVSSSVVR